MTVLVWQTWVQFIKRRHLEISVHVRHEEFLPEVLSTRQTHCSE